jgi:hypothetical protein
LISFHISPTSFWDSLWCFDTRYFRKRLYSEVFRFALTLGSAVGFDVGSAVGSAVGFGVGSAVGRGIIPSSMLKTFAPPGIPAHHFGLAMLVVFISHHCIPPSRLHHAHSYSSNPPRNTRRLSSSLSHAPACCFTHTPPPSSRHPTPRHPPLAVPPSLWLLSRSVSTRSSTSSCHRAQTIDTPLVALFDACGGASSRAREQRRSQ